MVIDKKESIRNNQIVGSTGNTLCPILEHPYFETTDYAYYFKEDIYSQMRLCQAPIGGGGGSGGNPGSGQHGCDRDEVNNKRDFIHKARFKDKDALRGVESWASGQPEVRLFVAYAYNLPNSDPFFSSKNLSMGSNWYKNPLFGSFEVLTKTFDYEIFKWHDEDYGDRVYYAWVEEDWSTNQRDYDIAVITTFNAYNSAEANVTVAGTVTVTIGKQDDIIVDSQQVKFCDNTEYVGTEYRAPIHFWVNQQY